MILVPIVLPNRLRGRILRTDLKTLTPWTSFPNDIHQAIQSATTRARLPSTPFTIEVSTKTRFVENEERVRTLSSRIT
jgi:hypothetical protein